MVEKQDSGVRSLGIGTCKNLVRLPNGFQKGLFCIYWWCTPLIPALGRQKQADLWVRGQPGLQSEFQDSQGYTEKPCLEEKKQSQNQKGLFQTAVSVSMEERSNAMLLWPELGKKILNKYLIKWKLLNILLFALSSIYSEIKCFSFPVSTSLNKKQSQTVSQVNAFNLSTGQGESLSSRQVWSTQLILGHPQLHKENLVF